MKLLPLEHNIFQSINAEFLFVSDFCFYLATTIMPQINLTAYQTALGQSFTSDSEKQIPTQSGQSVRAVEAKYTDSNGGKTVPYDFS